MNNMDDLPSATKSSRHFANDDLMAFAMAVLTVLRGVVLACLTGGARTVGDDT